MVILIIGRVYYQNGNFSRIFSSTKSGSNINLSLDYLNPNDFILGYPLVVTPNAEEIEISITSNGTEIPANKFLFPINRGNGNVLGSGCKIHLLTYNSSLTKYGITYRYKTLNHYSIDTLLLDDTVGYYNENQFNTNGDLIATPSRTPYEPSISSLFLTLIEPTNSYTNIINSLVTGDLYGVESINLSNAVPLNQLYIGSNREYQYFTGSTLTLTADLYIILNETLIDLLTPIKNGNHFLLHFKQKINPGAFKVRIVQNFLNVGSWDLIKEFTSKDFVFLNESEEGLRFRCSYYDGSSSGFPIKTWLVDNINESKFNIKINHFIKALSGQNVTTGTPFEDLTGMTYTTPNDGISRNYEILAKTTNEISGTGFGPEIGAGMELRDTNLNIQLDFNRWYINESVTGTYNNLFNSINLLWQGILLPNTTIKLRGRYEGSIIGNINFVNTCFSIKEL